MDSAKFKDIYMPFHKQLYKVGYGLTRNQQDAEDLLQDVYLRLWKKRDKLPPQSASIGYLSVMMRNLFIEQQRLRCISAETELKLKCDPPSEDNPEQQAIRKNESERTMRLIKELPPRERMVIEARALEDKSYEEIERYTGISSANIRQLMTRARKKLRQLIIHGS